MRSHETRPGEFIKYHGVCARLQLLQLNPSAHAAALEGRQDALLLSTPRSTRNKESTSCTRPSTCRQAASAAVCEIFAKNSSTCPVFLEFMAIFEVPLDACDVSFPMQCQGRFPKSPEGTDEVEPVNEVTVTWLTARWAKVLLVGSPH